MSSTAGGWTSGLTGGAAARKSSAPLRAMGGHSFSAVSMLAICRLGQELKLALGLAAFCAMQDVACGVSMVD